ncbi:MAG: hypothetical protein QXM55_06195 [Ignisphaera sp.]
MVYTVAKELRKVLQTFIESKSIKAFIATHKNLIIFVDDVIERDILLKNVGEILHRYNIQCEYKPTTTFENHILRVKLYTRNLAKIPTIDSYFSS